MKYSINKMLSLSMVMIPGLLASCKNNNQASGGNTSLASSVQEKPVLIVSQKTSCFQQVSGTNKADTLRIQLNIKGDRVDGTMDEMLFEKDARHGTLSGLLLQNEIKAKWRYTQEGMMDSIDVDMRLSGDSLILRPFSVDANSGKEYTDHKKEYSLQLPAVNCK